MSQAAFVVAVGIFVMTGNADELYYRRRKYGCELMHETGNCGMGWVTFPQ